MTGCRIGKVTMKNGGAELRIFESKPVSKRTYTEPCGTIKVTVEKTTGDLVFQECSFALDAAKFSLWQEMERLK